MPLLVFAAAGVAAGPTTLPHLAAFLERTVILRVKTSTHGGQTKKQKKRPPKGGKRGR